MHKMSLQTKKRKQEVDFVELLSVCPAASDDVFKSR